MKIKVSCGGFEVEYDGDEQFAKESLCSLISEIRETIQTKEEVSDLNKTHQGKFNGIIGLPSFLEEMKKRSDRNSREYRKFLIAAVWLHLDKNNRLQTSDVASALRNNMINKLSNPSDCLNKNIDYGHCERVNNGEFIVTQKGFQDLGVPMPE